MSQTLIGNAVNGWLVVAVVLFLMIVWRTYSKSARSAMERNGRIPFDGEERPDGHA